MYKRSEYQLIIERIKEPRRFIQVVMGARQIGKSTVVKQVLKDLDMPYQFFSADNVPATNSAWISDCWAAVRSLKESKGWGSVILVIDEIQKIANWSEVVKKEWDDEVDFVLRKKGSVVAIEVKSNAEKRTEGLDKFRKLFNPKTVFIVGDGGISAEDFLSMDMRKLF